MQKGPVNIGKGRLWNKTSLSCKKTLTVKRNISSCSCWFWSSSARVGVDWEETDGLQLCKLMCYKTKVWHLHPAGLLQHKGLLGEAKTNNSFSVKASPNPPRLSKTSSTAKMLGAQSTKPAVKVPRRDSANNSLLPKDDDLRNLTCKLKPRSVNAQ